MRARYIIESNHHDSPLVIRDVGFETGCPTITNDVEAVVSHLVEHDILLPGRELHYFDSNGKLDRILVDHRGRFIGFAPLEP